MVNKTNAVEQQEGEDKVVRSEGQRVAETKTPRQRIPFGVPRTKMEVPFKPEGYHLHWVNDTAGRVYAAQQGGYQFVTHEEVGLQKHEGEEDRVKLLVGKNEQNQAMFAYLMKIEVDLYNEDQDVINKQQDKFEEAIRRGTAGKNELGGAGYTPKGVTNSIGRK
jgi:hypothetical protein